MSINDNNTSCNSKDDDNMNNGDEYKKSTSEIGTIYGKTLRVTCVERKYKVVDEKASFIIVARKEFDEDTTDKMLHEDMELKTFLANYEITNVTFPFSRSENIKTRKMKIPEIGKLEIGKKEESESTRKRRDTIMYTLKRRELFDSLDLPEEFLVKDYIEAIEKIGMKVSNSAMPYEDLRWLSKKGKVALVKKTERGAIIYRIIGNVETGQIESRSENDQLKNDHDDGTLPSKHSIDMYVE